MNVRYRREGNKSYLIIAAEKEPDYQIRMIQENQVPGLLTTDIRRLNGEEEYYYDITGRQSLANLFGKRQMSYEDIRGVLVSVYSLTEELRRYLVEVNRVVFDAEYCFYNPDTGMAEWIFYEENEGDCNFNALAEFILEHTDHDDKRGVEIGYKFYKLVREANFSIEQMITYIDELYPAVKEEIQQEEEETVQYLPTPLPPPVYEPDKAAQAGILESAFGRCREFVEEKLPFTRKKEKENPVKEVTELPPLFHIPEYPAESSMQTELIVPCKKQTQAIRRFRRLGKNEMLEIPERLPCIIGKDKKGADIVIDSPAVSRVHARLYSQGNNLLLQDLNSKNGTFKNGIQLDVNESVVLQAGDEICFANLQYICE